MAPATPAGVRGLNAARPNPAKLGPLLTVRGLTLATAESCTGGLIGHLITTAAGASAYYRGGIIAYDNTVKLALLQVPGEVLEQHGAVSAPVAEAMAAGVRGACGSDIGVATTGIAGPGGGSPAKPVGLVYIATSSPFGSHVAPYQFTGDRDEIRRAAAQTALQCVVALVSGAPSALQ